MNEWDQSPKHFARHFRLFYPLPFLTYSIRQSLCSKSRWTDFKRLELSMGHIKENPQSEMRWFRNPKSAIRNLVTRISVPPADRPSLRAAPAGNRPAAQLQS